MPAKPYALPGTPIASLRPDIDVDVTREAVVGNAMLEHPGINAVSFTGLVPVGRALAVKAAQGMKKIQLEMGGKNPMVIME
ncbi:MAG: aldehyde dehydrogenase family protein, partial [Magnetovibrio sp.]|nr:aldehyde dehydrogenase family protein [Magnetovibrio sp.]